MGYYKKLFLGFGKAYAMLHVYRVNKNNLNNFKNDYRYIFFRCFKNILLAKVKLLINGYYLSNNKYKYLDQLHFLYNNIGLLKTIVKVKNIYKTQFLTLPLFNSE